MEAHPRQRQNCGALAKAPADRAGASSDLLKERVGELDELLRTLREVVAGRPVIDPRVVELLISHRARLAQSA